MHTHIYYTYMPPYSFRQMTTPKLLLSPFFVFLSPFPIAPIFFVYDSRSGSTVAILPHDVFKVSFFFLRGRKRKKEK